MFREGRVFPYNPMPAIFLENGPIHRNMAQEPPSAEIWSKQLLMSPSRTHCVFALCQCLKALYDRIGAGPLLAKSVRVSIRFGFPHGIERKQM